MVERYLGDHSKSIDIYMLNVIYMFLVEANRSQLALGTDRLIIHVKGRISDSDPMHFLSNAAKSPSRSSSYLLLC